jgi:ribosomal protein S18 acetylase RimI-like enzyme
VTTLRPASAEDADFIVEMLAVAADWRENSQPRSASEVMDDPALAHYAIGWPREDDFGVIAEVEQVRRGAAWWRFFRINDPGYGFVGSDIPEVSVGVTASYRGRGLGRSMMTALITEAKGSLPGLSLSVEPDNYARDLYSSLGFVVVGTNGGSLTMLLSLNT